MNKLTKLVSLSRREAGHYTTHCGSYKVESDAHTYGGQDFDKSDWWNVYYNGKYIMMCDTLRDARKYITEHMAA